jgi:ankyrin repeat protein
MKDNKGKTPLYMAVEVDHGRSYLESLLAVGANATISDFSGRQPMNIAIENRNFHAVELLAKNGVDFNSVRLSGGVVSLIYATIKLDIELMQCILKFGGGTEIRSKTGGTALSLALLGEEEISTIGFIKNTVRVRPVIFLATLLALIRFSLHIFCVIPSFSHSSRKQVSPAACRRFGWETEYERGVS